MEIYVWDWMEREGDVRGEGAEGERERYQEAYKCAYGAVQPSLRPAAYRFSYPIRRVESNVEKASFSRGCIHNAVACVCCGHGAARRPDNMMGRGEAEHMYQRVACLEMSTPENASLLHYMVMILHAPT